MTQNGMTSSHPYADKWQVPAQETEELLVYNTFTRTKVPFRPHYGNNIRWYNCGPTVYDAAHIGHARNYVTFDIIRRIMEDYFNYNVTLIMNITDIDDKIILRARQAHLVKKFGEENPTVTTQLIEQLQGMWERFAQAKIGSTQIEILRSLEEELKAAGEEGDAKKLLHLTIARTAHQQLSSAQVDDVSANLLEAFQDILAGELDAQFGHTISDPKIFRDLAAHWESHFLEDLRSLNVRPVSLMTRVTEFVPQVIACVQRIMENGYAYEAQGSIYFDVTAFHQGTQGHTYAKLCPWSAGNSKFFEEGEGVLGVKLGGKKDPRDFALWKASKAGEPSWDSPWGPGRPGWHIECSAMAASVAPGVLDIHSGGIDLAFPHHDNELAQSEAFYECPTWVNYFLHTGHVHIEGHKMSKSLKNFITIRDALSRYTARQLRFMFLQHQWCAPVYYKESSMITAMAVETLFNNYFASINAHLRQQQGEGIIDAPPCPVGVDETILLDALGAAQYGVHRALLDNFDTPTALLQLQELVTATNIYLQRVAHPSAYVLRLVSRYVTKILRVFGIIPGGDEQIGWDIGAKGEMIDGSTLSSILQPTLEAMATFRDRVRESALNSSKDEGGLELPKQLLQLSDEFRNQLSELGVIFEDRPGGRGTLVKLMDAAQLAASRQEQASREEERLTRKLAMAKINEERQAQKLARASINPEIMFKDRSDLYERWDERGIPTHDAQGQELGKNARKKLVKEYEAQVELYQKYKKVD